ncbi:MAG: hypothetical protein L0H83_00310 [Salinisphaera sp.]|nr:hypothetical protein [Salinisphaera sp.]
MTEADAAFAIRRQAAREALDLMQALAAKGQSVLSLLLNEGQAPQEWAHFPAEDARDTRNGYRFFYHSHRDMPRSWGEHGHFHVFAELAEVDNVDQPTLTHLVALSVDGQGLPLRLFAPNRWVTDERWQPAAALCRLLARLRIDQAGAAPGPVGQWLSAMLRLFAPQATALLHRRDARLAALAAGGGRPNLSEDRRMHVVASTPVSLWQVVTELDDAEAA